MKPALVLNFFARVVFAALVLTFSASAGTVYLDNNVTIRCIHDAELRRCVYLACFQPGDGT